MNYEKTVTWYYQEWFNFSIDIFNIQFNTVICSKKDSLTNNNKKSLTSSDIRQGIKVIFYFLINTWRENYNSSYSLFSSQISFFLCSLQGLNLWPLHYEWSALPAKLRELTPYIRGRIAKLKYSKDSFFDLVIFII